MLPWKLSQTNCADANILPKEWLGVKCFNAKQICLTYQVWKEEALDAESPHCCHFWATEHSSILEQEPAPNGHCHHALLTLNAEIQMMGPYLEGWTGGRPEETSARTPSSVFTDPCEGERYMVGSIWGTWRVTPGLLLAMTSLPWMNKPHRWEITKIRERNQAAANLFQVSKREAEAPTRQSIEAGWAPHPFTRVGVEHEDSIRVHPWTP